MNKSYKKYFIKEYHKEDQLNFIELICFDYNGDISDKMIFKNYDFLVDYLYNLEKKDV